MQIAFTPGSGFIAWLIKLWTGGPFCHCELVFTDGVWFGSSMSKPFHLEYHQHGDRGLEWTLHRLPMSLADETKIRVWCDDHVNADYDWSGILLSQGLRLGSMLGRPSHSRRRWFCSEACIAALQQADLLPSLVAHKTHPNALARKLGVEL